MAGIAFNVGGTVLVTENGADELNNVGMRKWLAGELLRRALKSSIFENERDERRQLAALPDGF